MLGRFIQADSIVPGAGNPLAWDRYAYTLNAPTRYTDPSGHAFLEPHGFSRKEEPSLVRFEGQSMKEDVQNAIERETRTVASAYARTWNYIQYNLKRTGEIAGFRFASPDLLFLQIHDGPITFKRVSESCDGNGGGCAAETMSKNLIVLYSNVSERYFLNHSRVIVHELGHAFNNAVGKAAQKVPVDLLRPMNENYLIVHNDQYGTFFGYAGGFDQWQFGVSGHRGSEEFADMFVGWANGAWGTIELAKVRSQFMSSQMYGLLGGW